MIDRVLLEAWVIVNAPNDEAKGILLDGIKKVFWDKSMRDRLAEKYPNKGLKFSEIEDEKIMAMRDFLQPPYIWNESFDDEKYSKIWEREKEIEIEFGRTIKSIKGRLRYMLKGKP